MRDDAAARSFRLAPQSTLLAGLSALLLALPVALLAAAAAGPRELGLLALVFIALYAWIWLRFRPARFDVRDRGLVVRWPLKRREIARAGISHVEMLTPGALRERIGWGVRVGAGGLWGGFGWLWTQRRGVVQMYVSRADGLVWIERSGEKPWLITPERPEEFVHAARRAWQLA
jgi:hypothetical protein